MKCPKCESDRISEEEKSGDIFCESCGTEIPEPQRSEFKTQLHEGAESSSKNSKAKIGSPKNA